MSYLVAAPELLASTAVNLESIGSALSTAGVNAAGPTTGLLAAAEDEVSATIANLFGAYGRQYQALIAQAATFNNQFTQALAGAGSAYAQAEATNAAVVLNAVSAFSTSVESQLGLTPTGRSASPAANVALIMGGTFNPEPALKYVEAINTTYIQPRFPGYTPMGLFTPEQFWPVTPSLGTLTFGQSVAQGVTLLNNELNHQFSLGNTVTVFGYSQSAPTTLSAVSSRASPASTSQSWMWLSTARLRRILPTTP
jgi:hypothetical protein